MENVRRPRPAIEELIAEALPGALIRYVRYEPDLATEWLVAPRPGCLLTIKRYDYSNKVYVHKFVTDHCSRTLYSGTIYSGDMPDQELFKQLLAHYEQIS